MKFLQRLRNLIKLSEIELTPQTKEQISNIISPERPRKATIIKMKSIDEEIKEILADK